MPPRALARIALAAGLALGLSTVPLIAAYPAPAGPVTDLAGVLTDAQEQALLTLIRDVEAATTAEIAVVTVTSLDGKPVEEYATGLFSAWGIGQKAVDNGVLVLVAPNEREMRIEVGYGLEGILPDGLAGSIIRSEFLPRFRDNDYAGGIIAGTTRLAGIVTRGHVLSAEERRLIDEEALPPWWVMVPFLGIFVAIGFTFMGVALRSRAVGALMFGTFFGGVPLALGAGVTSRGGFRALGALALVMVAFGVYKGRERRWREAVRGSGGGGRDRWVVGSFGERSSSSSSGSSDGFGGGSSGGGGASGRW